MTADELKSTGEALIALSEGKAVQWRGISGAWFDFPASDKAGALALNAIHIMSALLEVLEKIQDSEVALATLEKSPDSIRASRSYLLNLKSLQKRKEVLEEQFLEITKETGIDVCEWELRMEPRPHPNPLFLG